MDRRLALLYSYGLYNIYILNYDLICFIVFALNRIAYCIKYILHIDATENGKPVCSNAIVSLMNKLLHYYVTNNNKPGRIGRARASRAADGENVSQSSQTNDL